MQKDIVIIGAGLTGLSLAVQLKKRGISFALLEKSDRVGGQIRTFWEDGFVFESGPNTGSGASQEVIDLFNDLAPHCEIEFARKESEKRLIWKNGKFHALPSGLISGVTTPLFTFADKLRILGEPWRAKGTNPNETVAQLTARRLGKSFVDYAVDPFLSGIYAGDPHKLITRYALPKLYNLEQTYGSFIGGSIKKAKEAKDGQQPKVPKGIFSAKGGMENLSQAMMKFIGNDYIYLSAQDVQVQPQENETWKTTCQQDGKTITFTSKHLITTVGAYALPQVLPFVPQADMANIANLKYAPIVQAAVGVKDTGGLQFDAFGGLISSKDKEDLLGILFPSSCFDGRSPDTGTLFSFFMGGIRHADFIDLTDAQLEEKILKAFHRMLKFTPDKQPDLIRIFRHKYAIPQYELSSGERFQTIDRLEQQYSGLHIAGNLCDGIGMAHRIVQATQLGREIITGSYT